MRRSGRDGRLAERVVHGFDDGGVPERVTIWLERRAGGVWAVGRAVNADERRSDEARPADYLFEGYELEDALEVANAALEDDVVVSEQDRRPQHVRPFVRRDVVGPLERLFFRG